MSDHPSIPEGRVTWLTEEELAKLCDNDECRHPRYDHGFSGAFDGVCHNAGSVPTADGDYAFIRCHCEKFVHP